MNIFPNISAYQQWLDHSSLSDQQSGEQPFFPKLAEALNWPEKIFAEFGDRRTVLKLLGVQAGDYVLLPNLNALAWAEAASTLGADCILIDHHPDHWQMDLDLLEEFLMNFTMLDERDELILKKDSRTLRAVVAPHLLGGMCDMERLSFIALRFNLALGEDISQALGSSWREKPAGSFGHVNYCEFQTNPIVPFGRAVIFSNREIELSANNFEIYPMDTVGNQLAVQLLPHVRAIIHKFRQLDQHYRELLSDFQFNWMKPLPEVETNGLSAVFTSHQDLKGGAVTLYQGTPSTLHHAIPFKKSLYIRREDWSTQIYQSAWLLPLDFGRKEQPEQIRAMFLKTIDQ